MFNSLVLYLNNRCNLRCTYCYVTKNKKKEELSFQGFKEIHSFFLSASFGAEKKTISFLGGEPLLSWPLLKKCILHLRKAPGSSSCAVWFSTNGTLLTPSILDFCKEFNTNISVSLDGMPYSHNKFRKFNNGKNSFASICNRLKNIPFSERKFIGITTVIAPTGGFLLTKNLSFIRSLGFTSVDLTPVFQYDWWRKKDITDFRKGMERFSDFYCRIFLDDREEEAFRIQSLDTLFRTGQFWDCFKMEKCRKLFVDPAGDCYPCEIVLGMQAKEKEPWKFGNVRKGVNLSLRRSMLLGAGKHFKKLFPVKLEPPYFCPFSFYFWAESKHHPLKDTFSFCVSHSNIFRENFILILDKIKDTPLFKKVYGAQ